jgi:hypothetical protein
VVDPPGSWKLKTPTRARIREIGPLPRGKVKSVTTGWHGTNRVATQGGGSRQRSIRVATYSVEGSSVQEHWVKLEVSSGGWTGVSPNLGS